jgi:Spy/CpxP family protein refolding chaperone
MRKYFVCNILFAGIVFVVMSAEAQVPPIPGAVAGGLLQNKGVQEELKFTGDQKRKISDLMQNMGAKVKDAFSGLKGVPPEEQKETMQKLFKEVLEGVQKEIGEVLTPEQQKRLKQIERQQSVPNALVNDEEAQKALKLQDEQIAKLKTIHNESMREINRLKREKFREDPFGTEEKAVALQKVANTQALRVLSDDQKAKWKELTGEPFEVKPEGYPLGKKN